MQAPQVEHDWEAVFFRTTNTGRPEEEARIVPVGHKCGESARRIRLTVHRLPADRDRTWFWCRRTWSREGEGGKGMSRGGGDERLEGQDEQ